MASVTASTTPPTNRASEPDLTAPHGEGDVGSDGTVPSDAPATIEHTGSLSRRMMLIAAGWISLLLLVGGFALDRTLTGLVTRNFDEQLEFMVTGMIASAEIDDFGEVWFNRALGDQRFLEPNSGLYWQVSGEGFDPYLSRSLWDRTIDLERESTLESPPIFYDSPQFDGEPLRIVQRSAILPDSDTQWTFTVAGARAELDAEIREVRSIVFVSFAILGAGLFLLAVLQTWYGLGPLRRIQLAIQRMRTAGRNRVTVPLPQEVQPLVEELNALLAHSEKQAEEARTHAGNLAHALKTPLTVVTNAATAEAPDLSKTVVREAAVMRRQVDHHLARARAVGRRAVGAVAQVFVCAEAVERAVGRLYPHVRFDLDGNKQARVAIERQDLEEILGNLIENAAKYGLGSVFVTVDATPQSELCEIWVEDDGTGIPEEERGRIFARGARLDTGKPGTGLGLAIVRDVAEIYGGRVELDESEDLGGLHVRLALPRAPEGDELGN